MNLEPHDILEIGTRQVNKQTAVYVAMCALTDMNVDQQVKAKLAPPLPPLYLRLAAARLTSHTCPTSLLSDIYDLIELLSEQDSLYWLPTIIETAMNRNHDQ